MLNVEVLSCDTRRNGRFVRYYSICIFAQFFLFSSRSYRLMQNTYSQSINIFVMLSVVFLEFVSFEFIHERDFYRIRLNAWDAGLISEMIIRRFIHGSWKVFGGFSVSYSRKDLYTEESRYVFIYICWSFFSVQSRRQLYCLIDGTIFLLSNLV